MQSTHLRTRAPAFAGALVALALVASSCGGSDADEQVAGSESSEPAESSESSQPAESSQPSESQPAESSESSEPMPAGPVLDPSVFTGQATTLEGASFDLAPLANQDLIVWFWAPW